VSPGQRAAYERSWEDHFLFSNIRDDQQSRRAVRHRIHRAHRPNRQALGLDIASSQQRRSAADHAMLTGRAELTTPISWCRQGAGATSYLFLLPIYAGSVTPADDRAAPGKDHRMGLLAAVGEVDPPS
jgi:CHASE1-domain containing sensor protein